MNNHGPSVQRRDGNYDRTVLVLDDEESMHDSCYQVLGREGYTVWGAYTGENGMSLVRQKHPDIVLLDIKLPEENGLEVLREICNIEPTIVTIVITGYATVESAVEAMKYGASDFLPKPFTPDELRMIVKRGFEKRDLLLKTSQLEEENLRMRENFVSIISHEMRSPLVAVEQYLEVMLSGCAGELSDKQREIISASRRRIAWLLSLVSEWLSMARIQDATLGEEPESVDIPAVLDKAIDLIRVQAEEKNIDLVFALPEHISSIQGNEDTLVHLFLNLYSNAIKYNRESGRISTTVSEERDSICISIRDTGIGIPEESLPYIFDEFFRVRRKGMEHALGMDQTGTGLGLAIVKKIVDMHHGYIHVESQLDVGSTFKVYLPKQYT
jgi:signal transduction histidine kinase